MIPRLAYFKRYRMERDLSHPLPDVELPEGFQWVAWEADLLYAHAEVKFASFRHELDAQVFSSFNDLAGCQGLMRAIRERPGFCPGATWLVASPDGPVGTVQGIRDTNGFGAIQNIGVVPHCRGLGIGFALLIRALVGFRAAGLKRVHLEVTAQNTAAIRLYRNNGFRCTQTIYKAVEVTDTVPAGAGI